MKGTPPPRRALPRPPAAGRPGARRYRVRATILVAPALLVTLALLVAGCSVSEQQPELAAGVAGHEGRQGTLSMRLDAQQLPPGASSVRVRGWRAGYAPVEHWAEIHSTLVHLRMGGLAAGRWGIAVSVHDRLGAVLLCGMEEVEIGAGRVSGLSITPRPEGRCEPAELVCGDGEDGDGDGLVDCADADCATRQCDDGDLCTEGEVCGADGACGGGEELDCGDEDPCTEDMCLPEVGCSNPALEEGTSCGEGLTCQAGDCLCEPQCDGRECGDDGCDGSCGGCDAGESCEDGQCTAAGGCDDGNEVDWDGCTGGEPSEWQVNTESEGDQERPAVATWADGRFVVLWQNQAAGAPAWGAQGQLYSAGGLPTGAQLQISQSPGEYMAQPTVATLSDGTFVVAYGVDGAGRERDLRVRRFDRFGQPIGPAQPANSVTVADQSSPALAAQPDGSMVLAWMSYGQDGDSYGIFARPVASDGTVLGETELSVPTRTSGYQSFPCVAPLSGGAFAVAWQTRPAGSYEIGARVLDSAATPLSAELQANTHAGDHQRFCSVAAFPAPGAGFVVTWSSENQDGDGRGVYGRLYDGSGEPTSDELAINQPTAGNQTSGGSVAFSDGSFMVLWYGAGPGDDLGVFAERFTAAGERAQDAIRLNTFTEGSQSVPALATFPDGSVVAAWASGADQDGSGRGIFALRLRANGGACPPGDCVLGAAD